MKSFERMAKSKILGGRSTLLGGVLVLVLLVMPTTATFAANPRNLRMVSQANRRVLSPRVSRPVWVSATTIRLDPIMIEIMAVRAEAAAARSASVEVPARPRPRSPITPPMSLPGGDIVFPGWVLD